MKSLIWTAIDLKTRHEGNPTGRTENLLRLTLLMKEPQMDLKIPAHEAAARLSASFKVIVDTDWDVQVFMGDTASYLGLYSDVILCQGKYQSKIQSMQAACPVVNLESRSATLCKLLTHLMTLQLRYGRLRGLNLAWVGPPTALLNTYLCTAPYFGINICYSCSHCKDNMISPVKLHEARGICQKTRTEIRECEDCQTAVESAHVVLTSRHNVPEMKISLQSLEKAQPDWSVLCSFPRGQHEIDTEVINHRNSLVWAAADNTQWMIMALVLRLVQFH